MSIRPLVSGFGVYDSEGRLRAKVDSFAEAVEQNSVLPVVEVDAEPIEREELVFEGRTVIRYQGKVQISQRQSRSAICSKKPWESSSIGVNPAQAQEFTRHAHEAGNLGVEYDIQTGKLRAYSDRAREKELARRGFHDSGAGHGLRRPESVYE